MSRCKGCRAEILWRHHESTGKVAPIDATPSFDGNIVIIDADTYRVIPPGGGSGGAPRYKNHWATCTSPPSKGPRR